MDLARRRGIEVDERAIWPEELESFEQMFLTGTAAEVTPVRSAGPWNFEVGDMTRQLAKDYDDLVNGRHPERLVEDRQVERLAGAEPDHMAGMVGEVVAGLRMGEDRQAPRLSASHCATSPNRSAAPSAGSSRAGAGRRAAGGNARLAPRSAPGRRGKLLRGSTCSGS